MGLAAWRDKETKPGSSAMKKARIRLKDIDCFVISIGPGSFTGLRIGVTTVKGFAYALKKKIVAVPTLDVIARNVKKKFIEVKTI